MSPKLIAVVGATGLQGGSVARSLLKNKEFSVRGITRNPGSEAAKALVSLGAEVVKADGFNKDEMKAAFEGAWGAFVNTNSEDPSVRQPGGPTESDLGEIIMDAAAEAGVKNLIYSSGANTEKLTNGQVHCRMMMNKARTFEYASSLPQLTNLISLDAGWYLETFLSDEFAPLIGGFPKIPDSENYLTFSIPRFGNNPESVGFISITDDLGDIAHGIFLNPAEHNRKLVQGVSAVGSSGDLTEAFERVTGKKARVKYLASPEEFETYGDPALEDVRNMFRFTQKAGGGYFNGQQADLSVARGLKAEVGKVIGGETELSGLEGWIKKNLAGE